MLSEQAQKCIDEKLAMNLVATFRDPEVFEAAVESCRPKALEGGQIDIPDPVKEEADFSESRAEDGTRMFRLAPKEYVENAQDTLEIIYIHGGGFLFGIGPVHFLLALRLMKELGCAVTLPVYPTLPEAKYSAILSSAMTAYKTVREEHPEARIALTGDSAGGNLCIAVSMECRDHGIAQPNLIVPFSPLIDLEGTVAKREGFDPDDPLLDWYGSAQIARLLVEDG